MKKYDINISYMDDSYLFRLDYGTQSEVTFIVSSDDSCFINYGTYDKEEEEKRKSDLLKEFLVPILGKKKALMKKDDCYFISDGSFKSARNFINKGKNKISEIEKEDNTKDKDIYNYRSVYNETFDTISYYVKAKVFDDEFGIIIYNDDSYLPVISTKHLTKSLEDSDKNKRLKEIKNFVNSLLNLDVNFDLNKNGASGKLDGLYSAAINNSKKNSRVEFTDDSGDIYTYKDGKESSIFKI